MEVRENLLDEKIEDLNQKLDQCYYDLGKSLCEFYDESVRDVNSLVDEIVRLKRIKRRMEE